MPSGSKGGLKRLGSEPMVVLGLGLISFSSSSVLYSNSSFSWGGTKKEGLVGDVEGGGLILFTGRLLMSYMGAVDPFGRIVDKIHDAVEADVFVVVARVVVVVGFVVVVVVGDVVVVVVGLVVVVDLWVVVVVLRVVVVGFGVVGIGVVVVVDAVVVVVEGIVGVVDGRILGLTVTVEYIE